MRISKKTDYALRALFTLVDHSGGAPIPIRELARRNDVPKRFLEQIMLALKRAKYVRSSKGQRGGYQLAKPADEITLAEIVRQCDGALAPTECVSEHFYEPTPIEKEAKLVKLFRGIRDYVADKLEATTIGDVL